MPNLTERARRSVSSLFAKYGLPFVGSKLAKREVRIPTLYGGGAHLLRLLKSVDISFVQTGARGPWIAVLPAEHLLQLLETESSFEVSRKERSDANYDAH